MLNKNPETRLGGSYNNLKNNPVFASIQWHELVLKQIEPAFMIPKSKLVDPAALGKKQSKLSDFLSSAPQ